jgi:uncharacterized protein (TIGR00369 family)
MDKQIIDQKEHYALLEKLYIAAPINKYYNPTIKIQEKHAEISMKVLPEYFHGAGAVHGALIFKMMDDAGFFASNSIVPNVFVLTANFNIDFLRPMTLGSLRGVGKVVHSGGRQIITETYCYDQSENLIARGRGVYMPSKFSLHAEYN